MRILFAAGGSAGHINPALAMACALRNRYPTAEIAFIGNPEGMEKELVSAEHFPMYYIKSAGIQRRLTPKNLRALYLACRAPGQAKKLLRTFQPDLVVGTGGYVSWAPLWAASAMGIPCAVHESNALPGLAVRRLEGRVDRILLNLPETAQSLTHKEKCVVVGNPLREGFETVNRQTARRMLGVADRDFLLLSFGGSLGAAALNRVMPEFIRLFSLPHSNVLHLHGYGKRNGETFEEECRAALPTLPHRILCLPYIRQMPLWLKAADLCITRAGAVTLSELAMAGVGAILIPSPGVADNHQLANARLLEKRGAALLLEEKNLNAERLAAEAEKLYRSAPRRRAMATAAKAGAVPCPTESAIQALLTLLQHSALK